MAKKHKKLKVIKYSNQVTFEEKQVVIPLLVDRLRYAKKKMQSMTNDHLRNSLLANNLVKVEHRTLQKLIQHIRVNGIVKNLIAGAKGYYISSDPSEIQNYIRQVKGRVKELHAIRRAIEAQSEPILRKYGKINVKPSKAKKNVRRKS